MEDRPRVKAAMIKDQAFVELALRVNAIDPERLRQAMETRKELARFGIRKFVGAVLVEKNPAAKEVVREVAEELSAYWVRCPSCKEARCLGECDRNGELKCAACEAAIEYPEGRISDEDLAISIAARGTRRRSETAKVSSASRHPSGPAGRVPAAEAARDRRGADASRKLSRPVKVESDAWFQPQPGLGDLAKFRPGRIIGASAAGRLYAIEGGEFGALKVLDRYLCAEKAQFKKWVEYAQRAQDLPRETTPRPVQLFREGAVTYIVRPFVGRPEESLRARLDAGPLEGGEGEPPAALLGGALEALASFHASHLVHGNLKPGNVIFTGGKACLVDPGFHLFYQGLPREERIVAFWEAARYVAPEVLQGAEPTPESDIYAAGRMGEDLIAAAPPGSVEQQGMETLGRIVARMVHEDPVHRHPSAKEALRELRATQGPQSARTAPDRPARRRSARLFRASWRTRGSRWILAGRASLAVVLTALIVQSAAWYSTRKALASPARAAGIAERLLEEEIESLRKTGSGLSARENHGRWKDLAETFKGTALEARAAEAARAVLGGFEEEGARTLAAASARAEAHASRKEWIEALAALLAIDPKEAAAGRAREMMDRVAEGLHADLGLVYVPARAGDKRKQAAGAFLADAGLLTAAARDAHLGSRRPPAAGGAPDGPAAGISFAEAKEIARASGKRLPSAAEWDRLAEISERPRGVEVLAAKRLRDVAGSLYQWVEDEAEDDLARAGYGWLRGGNRPGVPPTHPVRRKKAAAHPDVGVRLVRDLPGEDRGQ